MPIKVNHVKLQKRMDALVNIKAEFRCISAADRYIDIAAFIKITSCTRTEQDYFFNPMPSGKLL